MVSIRPFQAIRPTQDKAAQVAALPYDVMNSQEARELVVDQPYSFLHIDKAEVDLPPTIDIHDMLVYETARATLNRWIAQEIFIQDEQPSYYLYQLTMGNHSQIGLVHCASIDDYMDNRIKKHEFTRPDKEQDRIHHVDYCNANTGPIFLAYRQEENISLLKQQWVETHQPIYDFISEDKIHHQVWLVDDPETIIAFTKAFDNLPSLYIADGHHRTASAVKVGQQRRKQFPNYTGQEQFNYFLAVAFADQQLQIFDYNRVVKDLNHHSVSQILDQIKQVCHVQTVASHNFAKSVQPQTFAMYLDCQWYQLTLHDQLLTNKNAVDSLDVSLLQEYILSPILGISDPRIDQRIDFVGGIRGLDQLEQRVDSGEMAIAFALYPTSISQLMQIADENQVMPPKSTWFEPKLRSGLFIHKL